MRSFPLHVRAFDVIFSYRTKYCSNCHCIVLIIAVIQPLPRNGQLQLYLIRLVQLQYVSENASPLLPLSWILHRRENSNVHRGAVHAEGGERFSRRGALKRFLTLCRINCLPLQCGWILTKSESHIPILSSLVCEAVWIVYYVAQHLIGLKTCLKMFLARYLQQMMCSHYTVCEASAIFSQSYSFMFI